MIGILSRGIVRIPHLDNLLEAPCCVYWRRPRRELTGVAGWGLKRTSVRARRLAARLGLPYLSLEDGFLRSLGLGVTGSPLHSLIVDTTGIYYDATRPSDLEQLIVAADFSADELDRARRCIDLLCRYRLSKYNHAPDVPLGLAGSCHPSGAVRCVSPARYGDDLSRRVLVVDQTFGDPSIQYGLADEGAFRQMLGSAMTDNPGAEVLVKVHPDVIAGKKKGYLLELAREQNCMLIGEDLSPWALLDAVDKVYVVTSQLGFEALMAGKEVHCFGMPFYAGWGLTRDRQFCERRGVPRSLEQVFAAAYLRYCRYINPYTGVRCELEDTIALIADQKRMLEQGRGSWRALGFSSWKRGFIGRFLGPAAQVRHLDHRDRLDTSGAANGRVLVWASRVDDELLGRCDPVRFAALSSTLHSPVVRRCERTARRLWRIEDGFIRSVGLGADLVDPLSLVLDSQGIYYDATGPSDLESLLENAEITADLVERATRLREALVSQRLSKYNVGSQGRLELPHGRRILLVPGQVETDASIRYGSPELKTNRQLLEAVRAADPDAFIIYKPHPDVLTGGRQGVLGEGVPGLYDLEVRDIAMPDLLEQVEEVHTLTSLTGFEALLRGVPVSTYGLPFYAGWGLTNDRLQCPRRTRRRSLDELVAATLILYPVYVDSDSGDQINAETAVELLRRARDKGYRRSLKGRLYNLLRRRR